MIIFISLIIGLTFGMGLIISGMIYPNKVLAFLDIAGLWDPSLALVMGGGIAVAIPLFRYAHKLNRSSLGCAMALPKNTTSITPSLMVGSLLFGAGWGLAGICPGPAIVNLGAGNLEIVVFVASMLLGLKATDMLMQAPSKK